MKTPIVAALAAAGALATPAAAGAAQLSVPPVCLVSDEPVAVTGAGFAAGAAVSLSGDVTGAATADALGGFTTTVTAPRNPGLAPRTYSVAAAEVANPASAAPPVAFAVVRERLMGNYATAIGGRPAQRTTWRFAGFAPDRPVYGHFRLRGRTIRNYRFGVARGVCGTLTVRARRVPVGRVRAGLWRLQMDQARHFRSTTRPRRTIKFQIYRRLV